VRNFLTTLQLITYKNGFFLGSLKHPIFHCLDLSMAVSGGLKHSVWSTFPLSTTAELDLYMYRRAVQSLNYCHGIFLYRDRLL
jgi:hypothetical protein